MKKSVAYIAGFQLWNAFPKADCCVQKGMVHFKLKKCFMLESSGEFFCVTRKMLSGFKIILALWKAILNSSVDGIPITTYYGFGSVQTVGCTNRDYFVLRAM